MRRRRKSPDGKAPVRLPAASVALPPPGFSYTREQDERPYRVKALHEESPRAKCAELARLYQARHGVLLTPRMVSSALRRAGVKLHLARHQEVLARPRRLAQILATMPHPTRDRLAEAYQKQFGIALSYEVISTTLRRSGISLIEPMRKPDRDEAEARGQRLAELAEEYPHLTLDQLGKKYEDVYGVRLPPSTVGLALNRFDVYRHRLADLEELTERPERLKRLAESNPDLGIRELAIEYERLYDTKLHPSTVQSMLNRLGIYRMLPVNAAELAKRPARLRALAKKYPYMNCTYLAQEYGRRYKVILSKDSVENALRSFGGYRQRPRDAQEIKERAKRISLLHSDYPALNASQLAKLYHERYGVMLHAQKIVNELNRLGIFRRRQSMPSELKQRPHRIKDLYQAHPLRTCDQLAHEYEKKYGHALTPLQVSRALNRAGIFRHHNPTVAAVRQRMERLKAIAAECPELSKKDIFEEYYRRYGERLNAHSTRKMLRRRGVYPSRGEVTQQRIERLKAIAAECPELSRAGIVREYGKRYGEAVTTQAI